MSEFQVEGMEIKKLLKIARKRPLPFAFNPGSNDTEHYLSIHRKKTPEILGKDAKKEGIGAKAAFGTLEIQGKLLILLCERTVPNMAKRLKKYLKSQKVVLNIEVRDTSGAVMESDVEDGLPDDPELEGEDTEDEIDKAALAKRLSELNKRIKALDPKVAEKLAAAFAKVVAMFKKEELERCEKGADQIEAALPKSTGKPAPDPVLLKLVELHKQFSAQAAKLADPDRRTNIQKALAQTANLLKARKTDDAKAFLIKIQAALKAALGSTIPDAPAPPAPLDARGMKLSERLTNYQSQLGRVPDDTLRQKIEDALKVAAALFKSKDFDKTEMALDKIRDSLKSAIAAARLAAQEKAAKDRLDAMEEAPSEAPLTGQQATDFEAWTKAHKELGDLVTTALTKGLVTDVDGLRKDWNWATAQAKAKEYGQALTVVPAVRKTLAAGTVDGKSAFNEAIPADVKPFAESRVRWNFARGKMESELGKLSSAILATVKDDEELHKQVSGSIGKLTDNLVKLDGRLEDKLDQIVNEAAGKTREDFKGEARTLLREYRKELEADFFQEVDSNSGFGNVAIMATAQSALGAIETVLK